MMIWSSLEKESHSFSKLDHIIILCKFTWKVFMRSPFGANPTKRFDKISPPLTES
jgi:hypothetical protein